MIYRPITVMDQTKFLKFWLLRSSLIVALLKLEFEVNTTNVSSKLGKEGA